MSYLQTTISAPAYKRSEPRPPPTSAPSLSYTAGGTYWQVWIQFSIKKSYFRLIINKVRNSFPGYATYLSIQFSIYNRLKNLELEPKFSYSTFGVSINVDSHKEN